MLYESQHRINTSRICQDINKLLDPTAATNWRLSSIKRYTSESRPSHPPPFQASRRLFIEWRWWQNYIARWILTCEAYQKGRVSLRAQGTKRQVIFHCAYACPKINHVVLLWNKVTVTGSLASLSMICLASKIICQLGCHLLMLCGSVVNLRLCTTCERRWQGLSVICLAAW
jgi:hypothetical protein